MSTRWTEEQVRAYRSKRGAAAAVERDSSPKPAVRVPRASSKLERELAGHLSVMELTPVQQFKFHEERRWLLDFAFPDVLVAVEIDGGIFAAENGGEAGKHARGAGRCRDMEKRNAAAELGWLVLNYGPPHIRSGEAALQIERVVRARRAAIPPAGFALVQELDGEGVNARAKRIPERRSQQPHARAGDGDV